MQPQSGFYTEPRRTNIKYLDAWNRNKLVKSFKESIFCAKFNIMTKTYLH